MPLRIGPYAILGRLGRGGEGRVFLGTSTRTGQVAVKLLDRGSAGEHDGTCLTELRHLRRVDPARVAEPLSCGVSTHGPYLATAYRPDAVPANALPSKSITEDRLRRIAADLARAIISIHRAGLIHCDIKPSNVLVTGDQTRIIDFGISRVIDEQRDDAPCVYYSRCWGAPEQLTPRALTPAVDVFGWGCVVAYLAGGRSPFAAETDADWFERVRSRRPDVDAVPRALAPIVRAALNHSPQDRPTTSELVAACAARTNERSPGPLLRSRFDGRALPNTGRYDPMAA